MFTEGGIASIGFALAYVCNAQAVGQVAGADDFDAVGKDEDANGRAGEVVTVHQGVDQQFLQSNFGHFQNAGRIEALVALHAVQVAFDEGQRLGVLVRQGAADVLAVQVAGVGDAGAGKRHRLDGKRGPPARRVAAKQHEARQGEFKAITQPQVLQHRIQRHASLGAVCAIVFFQVAGKGGRVQVGAGGVGYWHQIGEDQAGALEHALQFFSRCHMAFVGSLLNPDAALVVEVGFGEAIRHAHHHHQTGVGFDVFGDGVQRGAHMLAASVAQHLVEAAHIGAV